MDRISKLGECGFELSASASTRIYVTASFPKNTVGAESFLSAWVFLFSLKPHSCFFIEVGLM